MFWKVMKLRLLQQKSLTKNKLKNWDTLMFVKTMGKNSPSMLHLMTLNGSKEMFSDTPLTATNVTRLKEK